MVLRYVLPLAWGRGGSDIFASLPVVTNSDCSRITMDQRRANDGCLVVRGKTERFRYFHATAVCLGSWHMLGGSWVVWNCNFRWMTLGCAAAIYGRLVAAFLWDALTLHAKSASAGVSWSVRPAAFMKQPGEPPGCVRVGCCGHDGPLDRYVLVHVGPRFEQSAGSKLC